MSENQEIHDAYNEVVARYYDGAYAMVLASGADVQFYTQLARERPGAVLELGCGTGRVLLELHRAGIE
ncbi:MAG TPA: class I SAM-dependent methyltransferase, partial [Polyangiaceae bacterium]|nr:class I SAM-dependent methyltransferase [Polyangiaceae bacterium]